MKSMTGYGKGEHIINNKRLFVELKSVNHRFLDICIKMPKQFNFAEEFLRRQLQASFARGHIDAYLTYEDKSKDKIKLTADDAVVANYLNVADYLESNYHITNDLTASSIMRLADVIIEEKTEIEEDLLLELLDESLKIARGNLNEMRAKEGSAIYEDFCEKVIRIEQLLESINQKAPLVVLEYRNKLKSRIEEAIGEVELDESKLINEIAFFADRASIDEEITRLRSHLSQFKLMINSSEPIGRKLDFLMQEMNREVNTIGSKANDKQITHTVVELKTELEKLREQIQNIE